MPDQKPIYCTIEKSVPNKSMRGKTVVITGGGTGIGKAVAQKMIETGATVIIVGRREERLKETAIELGGKKCRYFVYDVTRADGSPRIFEEMEALVSRKITGLVNEKS